MEIYFELSTNRPEPIHSTEDWKREILPLVRCKGCQRISKSWYPKPVDIVLQEFPEHRVCGGTFFSSIDIFHVDFIRQVEKYLDGFIFGKCFLPDGRLIKEYVTCYTVNHILVRGRRGSRIGECNACGEISCVPLMPRYILRCYLTGKSIYQDATHSLIIAEDLVMKLDFSPWPDAELEPIEVRDVPIDNKKLPCDPPDAPWETVYD